MSDMQLLFAVTGLIVLSGVFLTFSWHKFILSRRRASADAEHDEHKAHQHSH